MNKLSKKKIYSTINQLKCPSCGVKWVEHLGIEGTCNKLQEVRSELSDIYNLICYNEDKDLNSVYNRIMEICERCSKN